MLTRPPRTLDRSALRLGLLAASLLLLVPTARAEEPVDDDPFDRPGFYAGLSGVYMNNLFEDEIGDYLSDELDVDTRVDIDDSGGLAARVGYRAASWFAIELQYEWIDTYDIDVSGDFGAGDVSGKLYDIGGHTLTANTKWIIPFWRIQPYLLVGAGYSFYEVGRGPLAGVVEAVDNDIDIEGGNQGAFAGRGGLGLDFYLTPSIVFTTEATAMITADDFETPDEGAIDDLYYLSFGAGLQYRF